MTLIKGCLVTGDPPTLMPVYGKRVMGSLFAGRVVILVSSPDIQDHAYIRSVYYAAVDVASGAVLGGGETKGLCLARARQFVRDAVADGKWPALLAPFTERLNSLLLEAEALAPSHTPEYRPPLDGKRKRIFLASGGRCFYCQIELEALGDWHIEHKTPRSRGGGNEDSNLVASCIPCNQRKRSKTAEEYLEELRKAREAA